MDLTGQKILAYLEEDDTRRVLFRVRPLMTTNGVLGSEDVEELESEGFLRVAPDRLEQHTFKERMRSLGNVCLINLVGSQAALGKVRPNKNFGRGKNENNRYIIYSDAIIAVPDGLLYEVVSEDKSASASTGQYYLRSGGRISGPYCKSGALSCPASHTLMPDNDRLFFVELPDKTSKMFYWPQEEARDLSETAEPETRPLGELLDVLPDIANEPEVEVEMDLVEDELPEELPCFEEAAKDFAGTLSAYGFVMDETQAMQALMLLVTSKKVQLVCENLADAALAKRVIKDLIPEYIQPKLLCASSLLAQDKERFSKKPWPMLKLNSGDDIPVYIDVDEVEEDALLPYLDMEDNEADAVQIISGLLGEAREEGKPIPLRLRRMMVDYLLPALTVEGIQKEAHYPFIYAAFVEPWLSNLDNDEQSV